MEITRRGFLEGAAGTAAATALAGRLEAAATRLPATIKVGACVVGLEQGKQAGLDGIEVTVGGPADRLEISKDEVRRRYKEEVKRLGLPIRSLQMGLLNECPLATDPRGVSWLEQCIDAARDLDAPVILVAFFGNGDLLDKGGRVKEADVDEVVRRLKAVAPRAKDAGVTLGIEDYLDAAANARILDRVGHDAVKIYYDCYNTGGTKGYDVPAEIRFLKDRIVQFHFKNADDFLETGKVRYSPIARAIREVDYRGWVVLETSSPTGNPVADARRNAEYVRSLFA
ncbi:sugar phosphate isomerase/epimerase family protein [Aquisphaera insulae]|uniref:sugar phosphate isomerase/epimerase family protein n=1 Tax=Aquisphaera insulae TaxID=2712864 RepID=UPI0013EB45F5|nr:sugar phosphate isomerase/epimerase family protein [Aquisphaera insulae]